MSLHDPQRFADIVHAMIDIQQHEGFIPECRGATQQQYIQGGSGAFPIRPFLCLRRACISCMAI